MRTSYDGKRQVVYHDNAYNPVGLWQLDGNLQDSSGNGFDLALNLGTERYVRVTPGGRLSFQFDGSSELTYATFGSALQITGDLTLEFLMSRTGTTLQTVVAYINPGNSTDGSLYTLSFDVVTGTGYNFFAKNSSTSIGVSNSNQPSFGCLSHVAMTRQSNRYTFFLNGRAMGQTSATQLAPTGGTTAKLYIGSNASTARLVGSLSSVKILNKALTAAQIRDEYNKTLGPLYGTVL